MINTEEIIVIIFIKTLSGSTIKTIQTRDELGRFFDFHGTSLKTDDKIKVDGNYFILKKFDFTRIKISNFSIDEKPINFYLTIFVA